MRLMSSISNRWILYYSDFDYNYIVRLKTDTRHELICYLAATYLFYLSLHRESTDIYCK